MILHVFFLSSVVFFFKINFKMIQGCHRSVKRFGYRSDPETIFFSCSTQLSMKFQMLIKGEIMKNNDISSFKTLRYCIYHANKMKTIVGILTFMSRMNFLLG